MITRLPVLGSSFLLLAGAAWSLPVSAQYYYGPGYGPAPYAYGPTPAYGPYNAPPPPGREYGRRYEDDDYPPPRAPRPLSARAVVDRLEQMGYDDVSQPRFTGSLYIVQATGPGGVRQQIAVDAIRGIVLNRSVVAPPPGYREEAPRRYGGRPLDTDDLYREPREAAPRRQPPRRETTRPGRVESTPAAPQDEAAAGTLPAPADPRLAPSAEPAPKVAPRPFEGRSGGRQATRSDAPPKETGARPFGLNPVPGGAKPAEGEQRKGAQPPVPKKKPVAEARPMPEKPVRVIQGVTPLNTGESRSQLDGLPKPPDPPAATGN